MRLILKEDTKIKGNKLIIYDENNNIIYTATNNHKSFLTPFTGAAINIYNSDNKRISFVELQSLNLNFFAPYHVYLDNNEFSLSLSDVNNSTYISDNGYRVTYSYRFKNINIYNGSDNLVCNIKREISLGQLHNQKYIVDIYDTSDLNIVISITCIMCYLAKKALLHI